MKPLSLQNLRRLFFALLALLTVRSFLQSQFAAEEMSRADTYGRVGFWIESSECTAKTGSFLTICRDGREQIPIEEISQADDRGHTLVANAYAALAQEPITRVSLTRFNLGFSFVATMILAATLWTCGFLEAALLFLLIQFIFGVGRYVAGPDVPALYMGLSYLGASFVLALASFFRPDISGEGALRKTPLRNFVAIGAVIFLGLAIIGSLREPMGTVVLGACEAVLLFGLFATKAYRFRRGLIPIVLMLVLPLAPKLITKTAIELRAEYLGIPQGPSVSTHGIAHNLYLGLGTVANPWGIKWEDQNAVEAAQKIKPGVVPATGEYFDILWQAYWKILRDDPLQVAWIYIQKLLRSLEILFNMKWLLLAAWIGLAIRARRSETTSENLWLTFFPRSIGFAGIGLILLFGGGLLQGILGQTTESFLIPAISIFEVTFVLLIGTMWNLASTQTARDQSPGVSSARSR